MSNIKDCRVILESCTPQMKKCYVPLEQYTLSSVNETKQQRKLNTYHAKNTITTEPSTPNIEPALATELRRAITEKNILTTKTKSKFILALNELEKADNETNRQNRKKKAMAEAIDSEIVYLKQLENIIKYFKEPLMNKYILSEDEIEKIFNKITMLFNINEELLVLMKENPLNIAIAFKKIAPFLKMYSTYAYEYKTISEFLLTLESRNQEFSKFIKGQESRPEVQMKLSSLLITPIQRIPRYCLLLKQILVYTTEQEDDYQILKESLELVEKSTKHINSLVEDRENSAKLLEIQNSLINHNPAIIKPGRNLIKAGKVLKMADDISAVTYLVAMTDILMFCKIKKENIKSKNALKCSLIFPLNKCRFTENIKLRKIFISCENDAVEIFLRTPREFTQWHNVLNESHKNIMRNRHTLRKGSSSRRPAHKKEIGNYNEPDINLGKLQRKRRMSTTNLVKENQGETKNEQRKPFYSFLTKRPCIRDVHPEIVNDKINDCLFPLRSHYLHETEETHSKIENEEINDKMSKEDDVFVFGNSENVNRGFNFKVINFFSSFGNCLKRFFKIK